MEVRKSDVVAVVGLTALALLVKCPGGAPAVSETHEEVAEAIVPKEAHHTRKRLSSSLRRDDTLSADEPSVDLGLDANGKIPADFNAAAAVRDCVESTGEFVGQSQPLTAEARSFFYPGVSTQNGVPLSLDLGSTHAVFTEDGESVFDSEGHGIDDYDHPPHGYFTLSHGPMLQTQLHYRLDSVEEAQTDLDRVCRTALSQLQEPMETVEGGGWAGYPSNPVDSWNISGVTGTLLEDRGADFFAALEEAGLEPEDMGGGVFKLSTDEGAVFTNMNLVPSDEQATAEDPRFAVEFAASNGEYGITNPADPITTVQDALDAIEGSFFE